MSCWLQPLRAAGGRNEGRSLPVPPAPAWQAAGQQHPGAEQAHGERLRAAGTQGLTSSLHRPRSVVSSRQGGDIHRSPARPAPPPQNKSHPGPRQFSALVERLPRGQQPRKTYEQQAGCASSPGLRHGTAADTAPCMLVPGIQHSNPHDNSKKLGVFPYKGRAFL